MIRFTTLITCTAALTLAVPAAVSAAAPVAPPEGSATSVLAARAKVSASLSETSFQASEAKSVKLSYSFSTRSKLFKYRLSCKNGARWQTVNRVKKTGRFKGSHILRVKKLFGGEPVRAGSYRLTLTADGGSKTMAFTVTGAPPVTPPAAVVPQAGYWESTGLSGPVNGGGLEVTRLGFTVGPGQATVSKIGFGYSVSWYGCSSGFSGMTSDISSPITDGQFAPISPTGPWSGPVSGLLQGTFDSPTSAHGTGAVSFSMWCKGPTGFNELKSGSTGTFSWTASKQ
jgi:hypothetical protein